MTTEIIIKNRKTTKILSESPWPLSLSFNEQNELISELLELASFAPYHHKCAQNYREESQELASCLPFRFYALTTRDCRKLAELIKEQQINAGKVTQMLHTADILFLVTWLPEPNSTSDDLSSIEEEQKFEGTRKNMEHIAAASAAIQNILIGATAKEIPTYWSSGGVLRKNPLRDYLNIPFDEILLGSLFLFPNNSTQSNAKVIEGHLRNEGKRLDTWSKRVDLI